ncbi:MAG TPA: hypothetical protein VKH40_07915 [Alloacidobacterium sp.]|nr:hypothetical protein [Alloacidobacterium sp.]
MLAHTSIGNMFLVTDHYWREDDLNEAAGAADASACAGLAVEVMI